MQEYSITELSRRFPTNDACLEEIKRLKFPNGIKCDICKKTTKHYKLANRMAYSCSICRKQVYPLNGTIFEKTRTPLRTWFFAMYLLTYTLGKISIVNLQRELGVTYKTAWNISNSLKMIMEQNNAELLSESRSIFSWNILNAFELKVVSKKKFINEK